MVYHGSVAWGPSRGASFYGMGSSLIDVGTVLFAGRPMVLDERVEVPPFSSFTFPQPAHVRLELRRVGRGLEIGGTIDVNVAGACDRCLEDVSLPATVDVEERFDPPGGANDPFGENNVLNGTDLDLGDLVRQLVDSALPMVLTCSETCRGLCDTCGRSKNPGGGCTCLPESTEGNHGESQVEDPPIQDA